MTSLIAQQANQLQKIHTAKLKERRPKQTSEYHNYMPGIGNYPSTSFWVYISLNQLSLEPAKSVTLA